MSSFDGAHWYSDGSISMGYPRNTCDSYRLCSHHIRLFPVTSPTQHAHCEKPLTFVRILITLLNCEIDLTRVSFIVTFEPGAASIASPWPSTACWRGVSYVDSSESHSEVSFSNCNYDDECTSPMGVFAGWSFCTVLDGHHPCLKRRRHFH